MSLENEKTGIVFLFFFLFKRDSRFFGFLPLAMAPTCECLGVFIELSETPRREMMACLEW